MKEAQDPGLMEGETAQETNAMSATPVSNGSDPVKWHPVRQNVVSTRMSRPQQGHTLALHCQGFGTPRVDIESHAICLGEPRGGRTAS